MYPPGLRWCSQPFVVLNMTVLGLDGMPRGAQSGVRLSSACQPQCHSLTHANNIPSQTWCLDSPLSDQHPLNIPGLMTSQFGSFIQRGTGARQGTARSAGFHFHKKPGSELLWVTVGSWWWRCSHGLCSI